MAQELMHSNVRTISDLLFANKDQFSRLLSKSVDAEKFLAVVVTCFQDNPELHACTQTSMVRFALQCARMDMMPGPMRLCYPIPYKNHGVLECQWQLGYKGAVELCWRSGLLSKIVARPVFQGDDFSYKFGLDETLDHAPKSEWWSKAWENTTNQNVAWEHLTHVYAFAKLKNGEKTFTIMTKAQCSWHRDRYSKAAKSGPWVSNPIEMSTKSAVIELANLLPASQTDNRLAVAVGWEKQAQGEVPQTLDAPFEIKGLQEEEPVQTEKPAPVATLPDFAPQGREHCKGKPVNDPAVRDEDLTWYATYLENCLKRPDRSQYKATDEHKLAGIRQEQARRDCSNGGTPKEQAARPPEQVQEPSKPAAQGKPQAGPTPPPEGYPADEATWQAWRMEAEDKFPDLYYEVKGALGLKKAQPIPVERRQEFYRAYGEAKAKG